MTSSRRITSCEQGATIVEFALLAPIFFMLMFGIIEFSRYAWTKQTLDEVAYNTARCMSVSDQCATSSEQRTYAHDRAADYGVEITNQMVTASAAANCEGYADSSVVQIDAEFRSVLTGVVPGIPGTVNAKGCFPSLG